MSSTSKALLTLNPKVSKLIEFCTCTRPIFLQGSNRTYYREQSGKIGLLRTTDIVNVPGRQKRPLALDFQ